MATAASISFHSLPSSFLPQRRTPSKSSSYVSFRRPLPAVSAVYTTAEDQSTASSSSSTTTSIAPSTSFYDVLGIEMYATRHEIKAAYRRLARVVHPDAASSGQKEAASAADEFIRVHEAYATLSDPRKRADYDKMLMLKRYRIRYSPNYAVAMGKEGTTSFSGFSGYTRRSWETDQCW